MQDLYPERTLGEMELALEAIAYLKTAIPLEMLELHTINMVEAKISQSLAAKKPVDLAPDGPEATADSEVKGGGYIA